MSKKILILDDDDDILEEENIEVIIASDPEIVQDILAIKPDLILLDEWLGEKKGSTICAELKNIEEIMNIPIVLISAVHNLEKIAEECNANAFIEKPFDIERLVTVVKSFIYLKIFSAF